MTGIPNGNAEKLANNVSLVIIARFAQIIGIPIGLGLMGWIGVSVVEMKGQIAGFTAWTVAAEKTSDAQDRRMERMEDRMNAMLRSGR